MSTRSASSPARSGLRSSARITARRVGSASAPKAASRSGGLTSPRRRIADALRDPPEMPFGIDGAVAAIGPVVLAIVVRRGLFDDLRAARTGVRAMRLDVVDEEHDALSGLVAERARTAQQRLERPRRVGIFLAHHDEPLAIREL